MRRPGWIRSAWTKANRRAPPGSLRDRFALLLALVTVVGLGSAFFLSKGTAFLMPGPLASAHGGIEKCSSCHTKSGSGKLSWTQGLISGDPHADSKACLTCHKMPDTAFSAHGASADVLKQSTGRLAKIAAQSPAPQSARAQSISFPTSDMVARGLNCATCHQEHQGVNFKLDKISNEQCRSCHVVKFDSFDGNHPKFEHYPFKKRTQIVYDHAGHFGKHYPELAKKDPSKRIPATCSTCHNSHDDKHIMAVAPFEQTCSACHLDQITGKERASGPKGIAFLTLPGLDLETLKKKNAPIGEWPDGSEAQLTPFMKVMISRSERGRSLLMTVDSLNLQDLTNASDDQINAVTTLVWEIKALFYALISGKASDVLGDLNIGGGAKLSSNLVADLTASIPRDVVVSAQQQWLPNLATEIANGPGTRDQQQDGRSAVTTEKDKIGTASPEEKSDSDARQETPKRGPPAAVSEEANTAKRDTQACIVRVLGQCLLFKERDDAAAATQPLRAAGQSDTENPKPDSTKESSSADKLPRAMRAGLKDAGPAAEPEGADGKTAAANAEKEKEARPAAEQQKSNAKSQSDDLLFPTPEEQREIDARSKDGGKASAAGNTDTANTTPNGTVAADATAKADAATQASTQEAAAVQAQTQAAPVISIQSDVDPESWAE